jgi:GWxTD domain-containing protein
MYPSFLKRYSIKEIFLFLTLFTIAACSSTKYDNIDRGEGYNYRPGFPELRLAATGHVDANNTPKIIVSGDVVYGSLIYSGKDDVFKAEIDIDVQIIKNPETDESEVVVNENYSEVLTSLNNRIVYSQDVFSFEKTYPMGPGDYKITVSVTDGASGQRSQRSVLTSLPNPQDNKPHITEIRILGKDSSAADPAFKQATTYDIQSSLDSLKFTFQVTNNNPDVPINLNSRLLKFKSDTSIARPMNYNDYSPSSMAYKGIVYDDFEIIQSSTRELNQTGSVIIEFGFKNLDRGNYRLEVTTKQGDDEEIYKGRDFGIKSPNYPSLRTAKELARPLSYLMSEKEYDNLMSISTSDSLKQAIDRFWLANVQNASTAKSVISLYYERVEEANKQFSNFKEGWKTDPGMMYILFGPPWYVDRFGEQMHWSYAYDKEDPERNFTFYRTKLNNKFFPFDNYLLNRSNFYFTLQNQQIERWRSGSILTYNL